MFGWSLVFSFFALLTGLFGLEGADSAGADDALVMSCLFAFFALTCFFSVVRRRSGRPLLIRRV